MHPTVKSLGLDRLSLAERILLVEEIWDSIAAESERLPLADGQFHLRCALIDTESGRLLDSHDDAARFFVFPAGAETGALLLEGRWTVQEIAASTPIGQP